MYKIRFAWGMIQVRPPSPFLIIANKILKGPVILNIGGKKWVLLYLYLYL